MKQTVKLIIAIIASIFISTTVLANVSPVAEGSSTSITPISQPVTDESEQALPPTPKANGPKIPMMVPSAPNIDAKSYILVDATTGEILAEKNADEKLPPASITKLMTMYIVSHALANSQIKLNDKVRISKQAWKTGGSRMFVKEGQLVPVVDLVHGIIVDSGNDACVALSEYIAGSESSFVELMNQDAKRLGMNNTHFTDTTGLPHPDHYSTARDLSILARAIVLDYPQDYKWYKQKWFTWNGIKQPNRNRLLWRDPAVDGMKTGHTKEAGYCLVASAHKNGMRIISVVMGTPSDNARFDDSQRLLTYGFRFYRTHEIYPAGKTLTDARVWKGETGKVPLGLSQSLAITIPRGAYKNLQASMSLNEPIKAPVKKGEVIGKVEVKLNDKVVATENLIALKADPKGSTWTRMKDSVGLSIHNMFNKDEKKKS